MSILIGSAARKRIGGSAFLEIQYCPYPADTPIKKLVAVDSVAHFQADSLYVHMDDINTFWALYGDVFNGGVYSNLRTGPVDPCGINYYSPALVRQMITALQSGSYPEGDTLLLWLGDARAAENGVYILGI